LVGGASLFVLILVKWGEKLQLSGIVSLLELLNPELGLRLMCVIFRYEVDKSS